VSEERAAIALPERMPDPEPVHDAEADRGRAMHELKRLTLLSHEERAAALRRLPGIGAMDDDVARAMASLPADAVMAIAQRLDFDAIGALAATANGVAGHRTMATLAEAIRGRDGALPRRSMLRWARLRP
jgi:hypothetical protein